MAIPAKKAIVFICSGTILNAVFFTHWKDFHVVNIQNSTEIRVAGENDPKKVVLLSFHPVGGRPKYCCCRYIRIIFWEKYFNPNPDISFPIVEMIDHS